METVVIVVLVERTWQRVMERGRRRERGKKGGSTLVLIGEQK